MLLTVVSPGGGAIYPIGEMMNAYGGRQLGLPHLMHGVEVVLCLGGPLAPPCPLPPLPGTT